MDIVLHGINGKVVKVKQSAIEIAILSNTKKSLTLVTSKYVIVCVEADTEMSEVALDKDILLEVAVGVCQQVFSKL